ncbi:MAG: hypothetical protein KAG37_07190, partial [Flavobacteriales bacterium]|nr:hypothetical protein [Flavobacteriales bacterium]
MKKLLIPLVTVLFLSFTSCDSIESLADIDFDADLSTPTMTIAPPKVIGKTLGDGGYNFSEHSTIDPISDPDIKKYLDKIKKWDIKSMQIDFTSVSKEGSKLDPGTIVEFKGSRTTATLSFPDGLDIHQGYIYDVSPDFYNNVEKILNKKEK